MNDDFTYRIPGILAWSAYVGLVTFSAMRLAGS
jgi:hypothetical protein